MDEGNIVGLTQEEYRLRLDEYGLNQMREKNFLWFKKLISQIASPISGMLLASGGLSLVLGKLFDGWFIFFLLTLNICISLIQELKADKAVAELNQKLTELIKVLRDGKWEWVDSARLVPGDVVELTAGEVVPADGDYLRADNLMVDESVLTGESLPQEKKVGEKGITGAAIAAGKAVLKITATGGRTRFGRTMTVVEKIRKQSLLEQDILRIAKFLTICSLVSVVILTTWLLFRGLSGSEVLVLDLSLLIAGVPISLPTVLALIIEIGVLGLAKKDVIVRRMSSLEDLANVNLLLTDKTGTLTKNQISVEKVQLFGQSDRKLVLQLAWAACSSDDRSLLSRQVTEYCRKELVGNEKEVKISKFIPADSMTKRSQVMAEINGVSWQVSLGAVQVMESLIKVDEKEKQQYDEVVKNWADLGLRTLAVGAMEGKKAMKLMGMLGLSDTLRDDAGEVIQFLQENDIRTAVLTGDNRQVTRQVLAKLILAGKITTWDELQGSWEKMGPDVFNDTAAFAEIGPEDKLRLAEQAKKEFIVAVTGDGFNDLPAVKAASVGIAVANAVSALKSVADIVLLSPGIGVIKDAIIESRKIFQRVYAYSVYRISESLRLIITILLLGLFKGTFPMTPLQIILIAFLNDVPIISLAYDRVRTVSRPAKIDVRGRFVLSSLFGLVGVANSIALFLLMTDVWHLDWHMIQTVFFLKLTVSGHMLIYVARTREKWFKFLPSRTVILATTITQIISTVLAVTGWLMPAAIPLWWAIGVWIWAFMWMQVGEVIKLNVGGIGRGLHLRKLLDSQ